MRQRPNVGKHALKVKNRARRSGYVERFTSSRDQVESAARNRQIPRQMQRTLERKFDKTGRSDSAD